jgi:hypothetical protein
VEILPDGTTAGALRRRQRLWELSQRTGQQQPQQEQQQQEVEVAVGGTGWPYPAARLVNTLVVESGTETPLSQSDSLKPGAPCGVRLNVGRYVTGSLLAFKDAAWPADALPDAGLWLRAVLSRSDEREAAIVEFYLPRKGDSFTCTCEFGHEHGTDCQRDRWARFPLVAPDTSSTMRAQIVVYYVVTAVHVQELTLPIGQAGGELLNSRTVSRLTTTFNGLDAVSGRTASVVMSPTTSKAVVNGLSFADLPFAISSNAADTSALNARTLLYKTHFDVRGDQEVSRYDDQFGKPAADFEHDLRLLAREGSALYLRLFASRGPDTQVSRRLPRLPRHQARVHGRPPILQIVDDEYDEHSMLWSIIYDLPLGGDPSKYELCPSVQLFGPEGRQRPVPPCCPHEDDHYGKANVVCPFGFWGLSCLIEQQPDLGRDVTSTLRRRTPQLVVGVAADSSLDQTLATRHLDRLGQSPADSTLAHLPTDTEEDLAHALDPDDTDVVYFYTHCGYEDPGSGRVDRFLTLGDMAVYAQNVNVWATLWTNVQHWWSERPPLVVLNGCHTTEAPVAH